MAIHFYIQYIDMKSTKTRRLSIYIDNFHFFMINIFKWVIFHPSRSFIKWGQRWIGNEAKNCPIRKSQATCNVHAIQRFTFEKEMQPNDQKKSNRVRERERNFTLLLGKVHVWEVGHSRKCPSHKKDPTEAIHTKNRDDPFSCLLQAFRVRDACNSTKGPT